MAFTERLIFLKLPGCANKVAHAHNKWGPCPLVPGRAPCRLERRPPTHAPVLWPAPSPLPPPPTSTAPPSTSTPHPAHPPPPGHPPPPPLAHGPLRPHSEGPDSRCLPLATVLFSCLLLFRRLLALSCRAFFFLACLACQGVSRAVLGQALFDSFSWPPFLVCARLLPPLFFFSILPRLPRRVSFGFSCFPGRLPGWCPPGARRFYAIPLLCTPEHSTAGHSEHGPPERCPVHTVAAQPPGVS